MTFVFIFIASFFILSACWITPLAGTDEAYKNHSKPLMIIAGVSVVVSGLIGTIL